MGHCSLGCEAVLRLSLNFIRVQSKLERQNNLQYMASDLQEQIITKWYTSLSRAHSFKKKLKHFLHVFTRGL